MTSAIGSTRRRFWLDNGFLVFPGFFTGDEVELVTAAHRAAWSVPRPWVVVDDLVTNERIRITDVEPERRRHHFKTNDLYLTDPDVRMVALSHRLGIILEELLGDEPVLCNSLNFERGSEQEDHLDTLYMTPATEGKLVATWMALEDAAPDAGPLRYYPESNRIEPFRFSSGTLHRELPEMPQWNDYMASQVERRGLRAEVFAARRGDLFIWDALLLHGGCPITDPELTRESLVSHYWTQADCTARSLDLRPAAGGWWVKRDPQPVPSLGRAEVIPADEYGLRAADAMVLAGIDPRR